MRAAATVKGFSEYVFTPLVDEPSATDKKQLDAALARLREGAARFAGLSLDDRIGLSRSLQKGYLEIAEQSVAVACKAKGFPRDTPLEGEEWATGPMPIIRHLRLIREALIALRDTGNTPVGKTGRTIDGRPAVRVFPASVIDGLLFRSVSVDVHLQNGVTAESMASARAGFYKHPGHQGRVVLVLGAGNFASLPVMDVLSKMFNEGMVCLLKMNPVNAYIGPFIEKAFSAAIERGFLAVVYGGREEGAYLVHHPAVDEVHVTGSDKTHDAIVWGPPGPEREQRMQRNAPLLKKPLSSELGNVSPIIVVPGPYTDRELRFQAEDIAGYLVMNASFVCCAAKMLVVPKGWDKRAAFLEHLSRALKDVPLRKAYYPGAAERFRTFTEGKTEVISFGAPAQDELPWTLITGLDPENSREPLFMDEAFCPVLGETAVGASDAVDFLDKAVDFANTRLWGTLSATLIVHPKTMKDPGTAEAVERAITRLRYGTVCLNAFPGMSFVFGTPPWGAYPGSGLADIQSGSGWVHNTAMLEGIEKVVVRFPLTSFPKPAYFPNHRTVHTMVRRLMELEENGSWSKLPAVVLAALRG